MIESQQSAGSTPASFFYQNGSLKMHHNLEPGQSEAYCSFKHLVSGQFADFEKKAVA